MGKWKTMVELKTRSGNPVKRNGITVTPEAQALLVKLPFMGFVWNRPVAVVVEENGRRERIAIHDPTRAAILVMVGIATAVYIMGFLGGALRWRS